LIHEVRQSRDSRHAFARDFFPSPFAYWVELGIRPIWPRDGTESYPGSKYYDVQVVSAADYRRLADPAAPKVTLADGTTVEKAPAWYDLVLPGYKPTPNGDQYVLITTKGTGHVLSYLEPILMLLGTLAACGLGLSVWNLSLIQKKPADA
jgi:hypothetical protein